MHTEVRMGRQTKFSVLMPQCEKNIHDSFLFSSFFIFLVLSFFWVMTTEFSFLLFSFLFFSILFFLSLSMSLPVHNYKAFTGLPARVSPETSGF